MMSLWDALRMNMMISYQELVRTFLNFCWHIVTENVRPYFSKPLFLYQFCECFYKHVNLA